MNNNIENSQTSENGAPVNQRSEATPTAKHDEGPNLSPDERKSISERWREVVQNGALETDIHIPRQHKKVVLTNPMEPGQGSRVILSRITLSFFFVDDGARCGEPKSDPRILITVWHSGHLIVDDEGFEKGISDAIADHLETHAKVELGSNHFQRERWACLECADAATKWNIANYLLELNGYYNDSNLMRKVKMIEKVREETSNGLVKNQEILTPADL